MGELRLEPTVLARLRGEFGSHMAAAVQRYAESVAKDFPDIAYIYASFVVDGNQCHLAVLKAKFPSISAELAVKARWRAFLESFEENLPDGMPYCAFAVLPSAWIFFDFDVRFDASTCDRLAKAFQAVCEKEFASGSGKLYIWDDSQRSHFSRVGVIELPI